METCLSELWELLRTDVGKIVNNQEDSDKKREAMAQKCDAAERAYNTINEFFEGLDECFGTPKKPIVMPEHVAIFQKSLEEFYDKAVNGVKEGALSAKAAVVNCGMCAICRGCSQNFYDSVARQRMEEKSLPFGLENYFLMPTQMHYYQQSMNSASEYFHLQDRLLCLKGFSSSTPTIRSAAFDVECTGGGLYINYQGIGIVIDPGLGFVKSMHKNGVYINNIEIVIITHDHLDHNADAKVISSLLYDLNNYNQRKSKIVKEVFELSNTKEHTITWIVDDATKGVLERHVRNIKPLADFVGRKKQIFEGNKNIKLAALRTKHIKDSEETYGIQLFLDYETTVSIGYTSDTAFFPELTTFFGKSDFLIFNVSDIYKKDVKGIQDKRSHLGYNGSFKLLKEAKPKVAIASEFCCTNGDFRMEFINTLSHELTEQKNIILGEIGLNISIPKVELECSFCGKMVELKNVKMIAPKREYGKIQYACRQCSLLVVQ